ncbi:hypothetical protein JMJ56_32005, partial [Belnapia sp. T18]
MSTASRRALLASAAALPAAAVGAVVAAPAPEAFATAWQAYQPYRHPSLSNGLGDAGCDAWCERQLEATERLAEAPVNRPGFAGGWFTWVTPPWRVPRAEHG